MTQNLTVLVDWGTSSFRLWVVRPDGSIAAQTRKECGMSTLRPEDFENTLEAVLQDLHVPADAPVVICGMAGSAQGWINAPYVTLPASPRRLARQAIKVASARRPVHILPGLSQDPEVAADVMRGEETLLLGLSLQHDFEGCVCLPGTHSKWANLHNGTITEFHTAMTGEVFALLSHKSTLSHFLQDAPRIMDHRAAFSAAVRESLATPQKVLQSIFSVRALPLLWGEEAARDMPARLSGLLIGLEIAGQAPPRSKTIALVSHGELASAYQLAFDVAGLRHQTFDAEQLARAGLLHLAKEIAAVPFQPALPAS